MVAILLMMAVAAPLADGPDTVVVCGDQFRAALAPWIAHRREQGHRFSFVSNVGSPDAIRRAILRQAESGALRFVLLVGDVDTVPTYLENAKVNVRWGSEPQIASDNAYADLDYDGLPELAVGRLSADSPAELATMVRRILAYENTTDMGHWRRRVNLIAGVGGFGPLVDALLERAARKFLTDGIPAGCDATMTYGSWRSPFCPDPRRFHQTTLDRFNEGCLFWVYIGHGHPTGLDRIRAGGSQYPILEASDTSRLWAKRGAPIAVFLSCYAGAFDRPNDCLAEEMLRAEGGPVAVLSASRVTMPYGMAVMGNEMLREYFHPRRATLGEVVMHAKRRSMAKVDPHDRQADANRRLLDALGAALSPAPDDLDRERAEHLLMFNLLGDPLLKLHHSLPVELKTADSVDAGKMLAVSGDSPIGGRMTIEVTCRRDRTATAAPIRDRFNRSDAALTEFDEVYRRANDRRWASYTFRFVGGEFQMELPIPAAAHGPCHVRVFIEGSGEFAIGSANVFVRRHRPARTPLPR